jgi:hypothetical protein
VRNRQGVLADAIATPRHGGLPADPLGAAIRLLAMVDDLVIDADKEAAVAATEARWSASLLVCRAPFRGCP